VSRLKSSLREMPATEAHQPGGKAAQAPGDFQVLRVHPGRDVNASLALE
jgi:hypothetical protein